MSTKLQSIPRSSMTGGELTKLRKDGYIPASISTRGATTMHCSVNRDQLLEILQTHGRSAIIEIDGTEQSGSVLVISRDVQNDPIGRKMIHVGFQRVTGLEPITAEVRVLLTGQAADVKTGEGFVEQLVKTVLIRALPAQLPNVVEADTSAMEMGSALLASSIGEGRDYSLVTPGDTVIAALHSMTRGGDRAAATTGDEKADAG